MAGRKVQLTIELTEEAHRVVEDIQASLPATSPSEVFRLSLKTMHRLLTMKADGWEFHAHRSGEVVSVLVGTALCQAVCQSDSVVPVKTERSDVALPERSRLFGT